MIGPLNSSWDAILAIKKYMTFVIRQLWSFGLHPHIRRTHCKRCRWSKCRGINVPSPGRLSLPRTPLRCRMCSFLNTQQGGNTESWTPWTPTENTHTHTQNNNDLNPQPDGRDAHWKSILPRKTFSVLSPYQSKDWKHTLGPSPAGLPTVVSVPAGFYRRTAGLILCALQTAVRRAAVLALHLVRLVSPQTPWLLRAGCLNGTRRGQLVSLV